MALIRGRVRREDDVPLTRAHDWAHRERFEQQRVQREGGVPWGKVIRPSTTGSKPAKDPPQSS